MSNYPNEKKERNKALLVSTVNGVLMVDRITDFRISSVRIGIVLKREIEKIMKEVATGKTLAEIVVEYNVVYKEKTYSLSMEKLHELIEKKKEEKTRANLA